MRRLCALFTYLLAIPAAVLAIAQAQAEESAAFQSPQTIVTIISNAAAVAPSQPFKLGLRQRITPGWHTYWSNPGDAGEPPQLALSLPDGASAGSLQFPSPKRIPYGPLVNFGYENEVVLPITVTPPSTLQPGTSFSVKADAYWLVCAEICIPEEANFTVALPVEAEPRPAVDTVGLFQSAEAAMPRVSPWQVDAGFAGRQGALRFTGEALSPEAVSDAFFFPAQWGVIENAAPQPLTVRQDELTLSLTRANGPLPESLDGVVAITDTSGSRSTYLVQSRLGPVPLPAGSPSAPLWQVLGFAALGGFLLNLMPCVFPILAMKAVSLAGLSGARHSTIRGHAASYTAGVVISFLVLGGILVALKYAGMAAGWGFQFTSPIFVTVMCWLMLVVGLNLSGVFTVMGPALPGRGSSARGGHLGSFGTGSLAVLVATPCTAPFMAVAIGAAFTMPAMGTLAVFLAMGLGMALPYALLMAFPGLSRALPRPGIWMERLKQVLAFPMYGAAAWLAWVLTLQTGADGMLLLLTGAVLVSLAAWAIGVSQQSHARGRVIAQCTALVAGLVAMALLPQLSRAEVQATASRTDAPQAWSVARVAELQDQGRPVFVNLTAAWCITCKVNERLALDRPAVRDAFAARGVRTLLGDWTRGDPAITALLRAHGRDGVPFYLLYPAAGGAPAVLPQVLTEGIVLRALDAAPPG